MVRSLFCYGFQNFRTITLATVCIPRVLYNIGYHDSVFMTNKPTSDQILK